jgi:hypothetical protein
MGFNISQAAGSFAGVVAVGGSLVLLAAAPASRFDVIDAGRINIREPDGTLRMVISNTAEAPGIIIKNREQPHPSRASAGMIFYNSEGTENGGLIFDGRARPEGGVESSGSLTFDRYEQDQVVQMFGDEAGPDRSAGIRVIDHPDAPMDFAAIARAAKLTGAAQQTAFAAAHAVSTQRVFVGRDADGGAALVLRDAKGNARLELRVTADGDAAVAFLDERGRVAREIRADAEAK